MLNWLKISCILAIFICGGCAPKNPENSSKATAKGGVKYGGVFSMNEVDEYKSLYPLSMSDAASTRMACSIFQGLVTYSQDNLEIIPCLAESWQISKDELVYTFKLRKDVFFQDDKCFPDSKGRLFTATDVKYCLEKLCEKSDLNLFAFLFVDKIKGAKEYYENTTKINSNLGVSGIKVIDPQTISIELNFPFNSFMQIMALQFAWIYPKEAVEKYQADIAIHPVGTGPFKLKNRKEGELLVLEKNYNYWEIDKYGNKLPYLDALKCTFVKEKLEEYDQFIKGNIDLEFGIPNEQVDTIEFLSTQNSESLPFLIQKNPSFTVDFFTFQHKSELFKDIKVRKAFNLAVDKEFIAKDILRGSGIPLTHGIVPPTIKNYPYEKVHSQPFDPVLAKKYLAEAGYPNGKNFPILTLQIAYGGSGRLQVSEAIQKMLQTNLGVNIELTLLPLNQHYQRVESGKALFWIEGWVADYPDPENFLQLFYGKFVPESLEESSLYNSSRYQSPVFDSIYEKAVKESDIKLRMEDFSRAAQILEDDAVIIPMFCRKSIRLLNKKVMNLTPNPMEMRDFSKVYFKE